MATSEPVTDALPLFKRLEAFLDALAAQGLVVDIEQRVRLSGLLLQLSAEQRLPDDLDKLRRLITPLLAGSPAEQSQCETTFKMMFFGGDSGPTEKVGRKDLASLDEGRTRNLNRQSWSARGLMGGALFVAAVGLVYLAVIYFLNDSRIATDIERPPSEPFVVAIDIDWIKNYPIQELETPRQSPWNRTWRWYYTEYTAAKWTALVLPWVMCLGFLAWLYYRMLAYLRREGLMQKMRSLDWRLGNINARFGDRRLIGELQPLRGLARAHIHVLDPNRTALASAEAAGLLKPKFTEVPVPTDFVVLADRRSPRDHLADYNAEVVRTMRAAGLSIEILEFNCDPTLCHFVRTGEFVRLDTVIQRFPDSIIVIFAAAEQLIDPARGRFLPAVAALKSARRAVLLTPDSEGAKTALEEQVAKRLGLTILRTTPVGVRELIPSLLEIDRNGHANARLDNGRRSSVDALTEFMAERPERWIQKVEPRKDDRRQLKHLLRVALGVEGLRWLTAATVYPELRWRLTLLLRSAVGDASRTWYGLDSELLALSRLPWFRSGWMPEWIRNLLRLTRDERMRVGRVILQAIGLADKTFRPQSEHLEITLAHERESRTDRVKADRIMLDYLLPALHTSGQLFALPETWVRKLVRKRLWPLGGAALAAMLAASCLSVGALSLLPIDECDLLSASDADDLRIGPSLNQFVVEKFFAAKALAACRAAVDREPNNGRYWLGLDRALFAFDKKTSLEAAERSASLNYPAGYNALGFHYAEVPTRRDFQKAKGFFENALRLGNIEALHNLAVLARRSGDKRTEFKLLTDYVNAGGRATFSLANFYKTGYDFVPKDVNQYLDLLRLGVKRGDSFAANRLGFEYNNGGYVPIDEELSIKLFEKGIRWGVSASAAVNLGIVYRSRNDLKKATYWAIFSTKLGYNHGIKLLLDLVQSGRAEFETGYSPPPRSLADDLVRLLAKSGDTEAQFP